jgi:putative ABC transport system permease protein
MKNYSSITYKYLKVQKKRTILTLLGIILSVALITSIGTMIVSMQDQMLRDAIRSTGDYHATFKDIPADQVKFIENHTGVKFSSAVRREGFGALSPVENNKKDSYLPPYKYLNINSYSKNTFDLLNIKLKTGRLPQSSHEIAVDDLALKNIPGNPKLGDTIKFDIGKRYSHASS